MEAQPRAEDSPQSESDLSMKILYSKVSLFMQSFRGWIYDILQPPLLKQK